MRKWKVWIKMTESQNWHEKKEELRTKRKN